MSAVVGTALTQRGVSRSGTDGGRHSDEHKADILVVLKPQLRVEPEVLSVGGENQL